MTDDHIIAELRKNRQEHAAKFNYNLEAIVEDLRSVQAASGERIIPVPSKRKKTLQP